MLSEHRHIGNRLRSRDGSYGRVLYNRFRYYDPVHGRYVSADPIGQVSDINIYRYAFNNPIGQIDPLGLGPPGLVGGGNSFGNPNSRSGPYYTGTDAERSVQQKALGTGIGAIGAGAAVGAAVLGIPVPSCRR